LAATLARKGVEPEVAEAVLTRFVEVGLIDDASFAEQWVSSRHQVRGLSRSALSRELRQRGVDDDLVRVAVERVSSDDELEAARALVRRRAPAMANDDPQRRFRRLAGMLARKGYSPGLAYRAIREELDAGGVPHPDDVAAVDGGG
jgi:regulatory protein